MPIVVKTEFSATASGLTTIPIVPPPTPIPELWNGLQYFLAAYGAASSALGQYPPDYPTTALQNYFYTHFLDASGRLASLTPTASNKATRSATFSMAAWFPYSETPAHLINGKFVRTTNTNAQSIRISDEPIDQAKANLLAGPNYTIALVYKADANLGGTILYGGAEAVAETAANAGWRFGFKTPVNGGVTIWQHNYNDRLDIARNTATGVPVVAIITGTGINSNVWLKSAGSATDHPKTFAAARVQPAGQAVGLGTNAIYDALRTERLSVALAAQWNREITGADLTYLKAWLETNYGPF